MIRGVVGGVLFGGGSGSAGVAAALPAMSTANGKNMSSQRQTVASVGLPSGDWSVGGWFRVDSSSGGSVFTLYAGTGENKLYANYDTASGKIYFGGLDDAAVPLGAHQATQSGGSAQRALASDYLLPVGVDCYMVFQKSGNKAQIWLKFNGHSPVLAAEEITAFGTVAANTFQFSRGRADASPSTGKYRAWFKLSYALTKDQIDKAGNGTDPTTFGTPAADDFYFPFSEAAGALTFASTINSKVTANGTAGAPATVTGLGYAPMTNAVFLDPIGPDGFVVQHTGGVATVALSGTYQGGGSPDIQVQFIDQNNVSFLGWQTIAIGSGGVWNGVAALPKGRRWIKVQMRKVVDSVASSDVMTSTLRWGVGENIILSGQSLMDYQRNTGAPYGSTGIVLNGYVSLMSSIGVIQIATNTERLDITGAVNSGGLIEITTTSNHGRKDNETVVISNIVGTTEANNRLWNITVTAANKFTLNGSVFTNAYVSGGYCYIGKNVWQVPNQTYTTVPNGHAIIANEISNKSQCVVALSNRALSGTGIASHYSWTSGTAPYTLLSGSSMRKVGAFVWQQGNNDLGLSPIRSYFADAGTEGAWTGFGLLGTLKTFYETNFPNSDFKMGVVPFTSITGNSGYSAAIHQSFRWGMNDWCIRKNSAGDANVFAMGWHHDFQPQFESSGIGAHQCPELKGQESAAARIAQDVAYKLGGVSNDSFGPRITAASRSGALIDLTVVHNGGTSLKVLTTGARPSGFEVATDTAFTSKLTISDVAITGATGVRITLSADPAATVYVRYMYAKVGDYAAISHSALVTNVADNGAGIIRVSTVTTPTSATIPTGRQKVGGHGLTTGQWVRVSGVRGATQANGTWQVTVIDAENFDLVGSSSVGLGTFVTANIWGTGGNAVVEIELAVPIYDDRTIGGVDTNGAPLQPLYTYVTAA